MLDPRTYFCMFFITLFCFSCSTVRKDFYAGDEESLLQARGVPCATVIGEIDGVKAYSNGAQTGTGSSCGGEGGKYGYLYQCKELISRYFTVKYGAPRISCHAGQCYEAFQRYPDHFQVFKNGSGVIPQRGDAIVFKGYTWGHVAIVTSVSNGLINFVQQNMASPTGSITIDRKGNVGSYMGFTTYGFIRHKKAGKITQPQEPGRVLANSVAHAASHTINGQKASQICPKFGQYSHVNTCLSGVKGFDRGSNVLVDCKEKIFKTCNKTCKANTLGNDDFCEGDSVGPTVNQFTVLNLDAVAEVESEVFNQNLDAAWVKNDLKNLCSQTLQVNGQAINTCRNNFKGGAFQGRFDDAKSSGSTTSKWLIDCVGASEPRWVQCKNSCAPANFGDHDSCR